jgi:hypothetical protein|tara:strand:- start:299 stop:565 length:267 start_codon:yes stop_codon:yes gene_type:complete
MSTKDRFVVLAGFCTQDGYKIKLAHDGKQSTVTAPTLLGAVRALEQDLSSDAMGIAREFAPDLHDITGRTRDIGKPISPAFFSTDAAE